MKKRLYLFLGATILAGSIQLAISRRNKKAGTSRRCCKSRCKCSHNNKNDHIIVSST